MALAYGDSLPSGNSLGWPCLLPLGNGLWWPFAWWYRPNVAFYLLRTAYVGLLALYHCGIGLLWPFAFWQRPMVAFCLYGNGLLWPLAFVAAAHCGLLPLWQWPRVAFCPVVTAYVGLLPRGRKYGHCF